MSKTYYVHSIYGDRFDGTHYFINFVESVSEYEALMAESDTKAEFYTEKHRYFFPGTKKACEEMAAHNNHGAIENGSYGPKEWGTVKIDGETYETAYDYKKKEKTVRLYGARYDGVKVNMETGEVIDNTEELKKAVERAQKLLDEHDKLVSVLTKKEEEDA